MTTKQATALESFKPSLRLQQNYLKAKPYDVYPPDHVWSKEYQGTNYTYVFHCDGFLNKCIVQVFSNDPYYLMYETTYALKHFTKGEQNND